MMVILSRCSDHPQFLPVFNRQFLAVLAILAIGFLPLPLPVNPEKYRLSGINPGVDSALFVARFEAGNRRMYYSVNPFSTELKAKGQRLKAGFANCQ